MKRRDFVLSGGAGLWALGNGPFPLAWRAPVRPIGLQLYTVRNEMQKDFDGTLARVAQIGYREVEFAGYFGHTPRQVAAALRRHHLASPSFHVGLGAVEGDSADATIAAAHTIGQHYVTVASIDHAEHFTLDDWMRACDRMNAAGRRLLREGLQLAYHNHAEEFAPIDGRVPFDLFCANTDPDLVKIELDIYWIVTGGGDPVAFLRRWPNRVPMVHVKDRTADGHMADVGAGAIDFRAIFALRQTANIQHYFVEHDEPADPFASIRASYDYLSRMDV